MNFSTMTTINRMLTMKFEHPEQYAAAQRQLEQELEQADMDRRGFNTRKVYRKWKAASEARDAKLARRKQRWTRGQKAAAKRHRNGTVNTQDRFMGNRGTCGGYVRNFG